MSAMAAEETEKRVRGEKSERKRSRTRR